MGKFPMGIVVNIRGIGKVLMGNSNMEVDATKHILTYIQGSLKHQDFQLSVVPH